jgi:nucleoside-diphosphate-sugar epimerase
VSTTLLWKVGLRLDLVVGSKGFIGAHYISFANAVHQKSFEIPTSQALSRFLADDFDIDLARVSTILWMAGKSGPSNTTSKFDLCYRQDKENLQDFLNFLMNKKWRGRFVFLSSGGCVYKESVNPISESYTLQPNNAYGKLKLEQEHLILDSGINYSILRVSNVFGLRTHITYGQDVISNWLSRYRNNEVCDVFGSLDSFRDYINIEDVISAISITSRFQGQNHIINIGSAIPVRTKDLVEFFTTHTHGRINFKFESARNFDRSGYLLDYSQAQLILGWTPMRSKKADLENFIITQLKA